MQQIKLIEPLQSLLENERLAGKTIGFVPTMGALHEGHLELMRRAKKENDLLVVSIFVNPIQFNNQDDLKNYPRLPEKDTQLLVAIGCDLLFSPEVEEMYPEPDRSRFHFGELATVMEGAFRPGHFNGVAIVVRKLFDIVKPHKAYFGEKDFQQLAIIKALVQQLNLPIDIIPCQTVRETDGLAMSSRNTRLNKHERDVAPLIHQIMLKAVNRRNVLSPDEMTYWVKTQLLLQPLFKIDYIEIADHKNLQPIEHWNNHAGARLFVAVFLGSVRLIDNIRIF